MEATDKGGEGERADERRTAIADRRANNDAPATNGRNHRLGRVYNGGGGGGCGGGLRGRCSPSPTRKRRERGQRKKLLLLLL